MNLIRNLVSGYGVHQGTPAALITLTSEPTWEQIEQFPNDVMHSHIVIDGDDPLKWNLDQLLDRLQSHTALCFTQVITSGNYPFLGATKPDWLSIRVTHDQPEHWDTRLGWKTDEVMFYVCPKLTADRVREVVEKVRNFDLAVSFIPFTEYMRTAAIQKTVTFDQYYSGYGRARYIEPMFDEGVFPT